MTTSFLNLDTQKIYEEPIKSEPSEVCDVSFYSESSSNANSSLSDMSFQPWPGNNVSHTSAFSEYPSASLITPYYSQPYNTIYQRNFGQNLSNMSMMMPSNQYFNYQQNQQYYQFDKMASNLIPPSFGMNLGQMPSSQSYYPFDKPITTYNPWPTPMMSQFSFGYQNMANSPVVPPQLPPPNGTVGNISESPPPLPSLDCIFERPTVPPPPYPTPIPVTPGNQMMSSNVPGMAGNSSPLFEMSHRVKPSFGPNGEPISVEDALTAVKLWSKSGIPPSPKNTELSSPERVMEEVVKQKRIFLNKTQRRILIREYKPYYSTHDCLRIARETNIPAMKVRKFFQAYAHQLSAANKNHEGGLTK